MCMDNLRLSRIYQNRGTFLSQMVHSYQHRAMASEISPSLRNLVMELIKFVSVHVIWKMGRLGVVEFRLWSRKERSLSIDKFNYSDEALEKPCTIKLWNMFINIMHDSFYRIRMNLKDYGRYSDPEMYYFWADHRPEDLDLTWTLVCAQIYIPTISPGNLSYKKQPCPTSNSLRTSMSNFSLGLLISWNLVWNANCQ